MNKKMRLLVRCVRTLFFPERCYLCSEIICLNERFCEKCSSDKNISELLNDNAKEEKVNNMHFSRLIYPFYYEGIIVDCIHRFKYKDHCYIGEFFAEKMTDAINELYKDEEIDFLTFIPSAKRKRASRGYNQGEILAREISYLTDIPYAPKMLRKIRHTEAQMSLSKEKRMTNLKNAFVFTGENDVTDKTVLICDDVKTTGSTLDECSKVLLKAGAKRVICVCVAASGKGK